MSIIENYSRQFSKIVKICCGLKNLVEVCDGNFFFFRVLVHYVPLCCVELQLIVPYETICSHYKVEINDPNTNMN